MGNGSNHYNVITTYHQLSIFVGFIFCGISPILRTMVGSKPSPFHPFIGSNRSEGGVDCSPQETYLGYHVPFWYVCHVT